MNPSALPTVTDHRAETLIDARQANAGIVELDRTAWTAPTGDARPQLASPVPIFVDTTGRRARWLRVLAVLLCLVFAVYLGMLTGGVLGSSVDLSTNLPQVTAPASAR